MVITPRIPAEDRHTRAGSALCALRRNSGRELARFSKSSPAEPLTRCSVASHLASRGYLGSRISRHFSKAPMTLINADYRGGVTCLYDTQLLGACMHASECGGRSRPQAVRGMPDVPIAPPSHRAPGGVGGCRLCQPSLFQQGVVGAFAWGFGFLTSDFGVGKSQDLSY